MNWDDSELIQAVETSHSLAEVARKLGYETYGCNSKTISKHIRRLGLNLSHFHSRQQSAQLARAKRNLTLIQEQFKENSLAARKEIKKVIISCNLIPYQCAICALSSWQDKPISLHLDHINGQNNDHRLENLRFLCPNCHSQTDSYCGKKLKKSKNCLCCGVPVFKTSEKCRKCESISRFNNKTKIVWPSYEELESLIIESGSVTAAAKKLGVSFQAVKKRLKRWDLSESNR